VLWKHHRLLRVRPRRDQRLRHARRRSW
jgi:hypothetical protein